MKSTIEQMHSLFMPKQRLIKIPTSGHEHYDYILLEADGMHYQVYFSHGEVISIPAYEDSDNIPVDVKTQNDCSVDKLEIRGLFCHSDETDKYEQVSLIGVDDMAAILTELENYIIENA